MFFYDDVFYKAYLWQMRIQGNSASCEGRASSFVGFAWMIHLLCFSVLLDIFNFIQIDLDSRETVIGLFVIVIIPQLMAFIFFNEKRSKEIITQCESESKNRHKKISTYVSIYWIMTFVVFLLITYYWLKTS